MQPAKPVGRPPSAPVLARPQEPVELRAPLFCNAVMTGLGQILPPRNVRGMSVIPPKAAVNANIFVRPVRATNGHE
jgi:hypothetical protein